MCFHPAKSLICINHWLIFCRFSFCVSVCPDLQMQLDDRKKKKKKKKGHINTTNSDVMTRLLLT